MTRLIVPDMVKRKSGAIINISSAAGRVPIGMCAVPGVMVSHLTEPKRWRGHPLLPFLAVVAAQAQPVNY